MLFDGVTFSVAGVVVLSIAILRAEDIGLALLGRRIWSCIAGVATATLCAVAYFSPLDFRRGFETTVEVAAKELQRPLEAVMKAALPATTTTSTSAPPPMGGQRPALGQP